MGVAMKLFATGKYGLQLRSIRTSLSSLLHTLIKKHTGLALADIVGSLQFAVEVKGKVARFAVDESLYPVSMIYKHSALT